MIQYASTVVGTLMLQIFLCMQETKENFGPRVCKIVQAFMDQHKNGFITASKSGKLTKHNFPDFVENISPYCKNHKFALILDSWRGQTDIDYFNSILIHEEGNCTSTLEITPPYCIPFCKPCNAHFFRQIKNFIKQLQNAIEISQNNHELSHREDTLYQFSHCNG